MGWRSTAAPIVRWGGVLIGALFAVSGAWSLVSFFARPNKRITSFVIYVYAVIFGLLLVLAELQIWPPLELYFGFLKLGSGRAWFLFFIAMLCLSGGLTGPRGAIDHILLTTAGIAGIVLAILGLIIRNDPSVTNRSPAEMPNVLNRGDRTNTRSAPRSGPDVEI